MLTKVQSVLNSTAHFQTQKPLSIITADVLVFLNVECSEVFLRLTLCSACFCLSRLCIVYTALCRFKKGE